MAGPTAGGRTGKPAAMDGAAAAATVADAIPARGDHHGLCGDDERFHARSTVVARAARGQLDADALPDPAIASEDRNASSGLVVQGGDFLCLHRERQRARLANAGSER